MFCLCRYNKQRSEHLHSSNDGLVFFCYTCNNFLQKGFFQALIGVHLRCNVLRFFVTYNFGHPRSTACRTPILEDPFRNSRLVNAFYHGRYLILGMTVYNNRAKNALEVFGFKNITFHNQAAREPTLLVANGYDNRRRTEQLDKKSGKI